LSIFKSYDIRGVFNKELLPEQILKIGQCFSDYIKQKACIARDVRTSSELIKNAFIAGFVSGGQDIIDLGILPTPVSNYYGFNHKIENITITGSHTDPKCNGIKFYDKLGISYNNRLKRIEKKFQENDFKRSNWDELGKINIDKQAVKEYQENIINNISLEKPLKIVLDHGNGTSSIATKVLEKIGCKIIDISKEPNGHFPNRSPEPKKDNLNFLAKRVKETRADFGCAFDGDADRSVFVDDMGRIIDGSTMSCFFAKELLKQKRHACIVASVDMSSALKTIVEENEGNLIWCPVGMTKIEHILIDNKGLFAGEVSGHFYFNDFYPFSDGILSCAKLAQALSKTEKKLSSLIDELPQYPILHKKYNYATHEEKFEKFEKIKQELEKKYKPDYLDGVKIFLNKTDWILMRPSNTEPAIRITIECSNEENLKKNEIYFDKYITNLM